MRLFICEKPSVASSVAKFLGKVTKKEGFIELENGDAVTWCVGHLLEMVDPEDYDPAFKAWNIAHLPIIPADNEWKMRVKPSTKKQFAVVKKLLSRASVVVIGCDIGREGELIGRELLEFCGFKGDVQRLWLNSMDDESIQFALNNLRSGDASYLSYLSALARSRADWLVGINLTRLVTLKAQANGLSGTLLSVGRIQSPSTSFVVVRDREIENFKPVPYFVLSVNFLTSENVGFKGVLRCSDGDQMDAEGRCINESYLQSLAERVRDCRAEVFSVDSKRSKVQPPLPLSLSALQMEASKKWGYGVKQTLDSAQILYEKHGLVSYPRVDCRYIPEPHFDKAESVISAVLSSIPAFSTLRDHLSLEQKSRAWNDKKITEHHAIIPTGVEADSALLSEVERNIYQLICRYYLAQFLSNHAFISVEAVIKANGVDFVAKGKQVVVAGWKVLFGNDSDDDAEKSQDLPALQENEKVTLVKPQVASKLTSPPPYFTEGTWIGAMLNAARYVTDPRLKKLLKETSGLGTEATRASIFEILIERNYVVRSGKWIKSTPQGRALVDALPAVIKDPGMSALWEQALDDISTGAMSMESFMSKQKAAIGQLMSLVGTVTLPAGFQESQASTKPSSRVSGKPKAPKICVCGKAMVVKNGEFGKFYGCSNYPTCKETIQIGKRKKKTAA